MPDYKYLYTFAATGIQAFIQQDAKLKDMVGASELVDRLPSDPLTALLDATCGKGNWKQIMGAAGSARVLLTSEEHAKSMAKTLPLLAAHFAPGIGLSQAIVPFNGRLGESLKSAAVQAQASRNVPLAQLPEACGIMRKDPQSGLPIYRNALNGDSLSRPCSAKRFQFEKESHGTSGLLRRLIETPTGLIHAQWPQDFTDIAGKDSGHYLAVVHADINGLGSTVAKFLDSLDSMGIEDACEAYSKFSNGLQRCAENAMRCALKAFIAAFDQEPSSSAPLYPFRPLICAGDDLTFVIRSDQAFKFTASAVTALTDEARKLFDQMDILDKEPTAAAGICFVNSHFPFRQAYEMAESLCKFAKDRSKRQFSGLAFHRHTAAQLPDDFAKFRKVKLDDKPLLLTMAPYAISIPSTLKDADVVSLKLLESLSEKLRHLPRGPVRNLVTKIQSSASWELVKRDWQRIEEIATEKSKAFTEVCEVLNEMGPPTGPDYPDFCRKFNADADAVTALFDALEFSVLMGKATKDEA